MRLSLAPRRGAGSHRRRARPALPAAVALLGMTLVLPLVPGGGADPASGVAQTDSRTARTEPAAYSRTTTRVFSPRGPFNRAIGPRVRLAPRSRAMVRVLAGKGYATAQVYADTPPVFRARATTKRYRIRCTQPWGTCDLERQRVPIPRRATASPGYDRNMVVIDRRAGKVYEFWQYDDNRATTSWGSVCSLTGPGTGNGRRSPCRAGAVGAGVSRLAGVIRTHEVRRGRIDHALVGPTGNSCRRFRYPAVKSDGWSTARNCIPEGARVQLHPDVRCGRLRGITRVEAMVCRALKRYGWYNIDNGGPRGAPGFGIQFENPKGGRNPYRAHRLYDYRPLRHIPWSRLRVLRAWNSHD